jgi:hypothetical protein
MLQPEPTDLMFPARTQNQVERYAKTDLARQPDFTDITKAFSSLMANPSLIARGGTFNDPMQAQQEATPGYLSARSGVAQNRMNQIGADATLSQSAGAARGNILDLIPQLLAQRIGGQGSLFGALLGGLQ